MRAARSTWSLLVCLQPSEAFLASCRAAAVQRNAIKDEFQCFTLRLTRRTVPVAFSMMLVKVSERLSSVGSPSRVTVRISSRPSGRLSETPGASRSRRCRDCSRPCRRRSAPKLGAARGGPKHAAISANRSMMLRAPVNLAALNRGVAPEAAPDRLGQRLRAVDDEQSRRRRISVCKLRFNCQ